MFNPEISVTLFVGDQTVMVTSFPHSKIEDAFVLFKQYIDDGKQATISSF